MHSLDVVSGNVVKAFGVVRLNDRLHFRVFTVT